MIFIIFDLSVQRKQKSVADAAKRADSIVRSLYPGTMTDRLYEKNRQQRYGVKNSNDSGVFVATHKSRLLNLLRSPTDPQNGVHIDNEPLADLYPSASVVFAGKFSSHSSYPIIVENFVTTFYDSNSLLCDVYVVVDMAGFTSWSTERHPSAVFTLLERIYKSMDHVTKAFGVFKVETIGDCYVAAVRHNQLDVFKF
jgi:Adenylate and Guanylate cyclase catalytic domain